MGMVRLTLFPFFRSWWIQQTSMCIYIVLFVLYSVQVTVIAAHCFGKPEEFEVGSGFQQHS